MQKEPQISFRDIEPSDAIRDKILERIERLERYSDEIIGCQVVVETPHRHKNKGKLYQVAIDLTVPGNEIIADRHPDEHQSHEDIYVALNEAFEAAERQIKDWAEQRRGEVKRDDSLSKGRVARLEPNQDHGFINPSETSGHVYFHRNAVVGSDFDEFEVGTPVRYHEEQGEDGPQASTVHVLSDAASIPGR